MAKGFAKYFFSICFLLLFKSSHGQPPIPQGNFIRVWEATSPQSNAANLTLSNTLDKSRITTQYFDGLGRQVQTVVKQGSLTSGSSPVDLVESFTYNSLGIEEYKYLPFAANATGGFPLNDGVYKSNALQQQQVFNQSQYPGENYYYAHKKIESSPLHRAVEVYAAGDSWVGTENTSKHGVKMNYLTNTPTDDVKKWTVGYGPAPMPYNFQVSISNIGGGQQSVTYYWNTIPNAGTVLLMYRTLPSGSWNSSAGSPVSPRSWVMPLGTYEYAIQIYFNNGNPPQTVVAGSGGMAATYTCNGSYNAGELYKTTIEDEDGKQFIEFKDKDGKVILKKQQLTASSDNGNGSGYLGWLCTYYIYDDFNNLRCVVQPKGVEAMNNASNWTLDATMLSELCFRYEYDGRGRMIIKKVPGAAEVYMVYDARDRLVLTQDGNLRGQNKWLFTKYDQLNRPIMNGFYSNATHIGQSSMQSYLNTQNMGFYENYQTATFPLYSLNQSFPVVNYSDVLTVTYYDDYTWAGWYGFSPTKDNSYDNVFNAPSSAYPDPLTQGKATKGMVTGAWDKTGIVTISYYDDKGRVLQTKTYNYTGGIDIATIQYSFSGQVLQNVLKHEKAGTNPQIYTVISRNEYDVAGRLLKIKKRVNSSSTSINTDKVIVQNSYDELGQLKTKKLSPDYNSGAGLETLNYDYNIRGWMLGINRDYAKSSSTSNYFGFDLGFDKTSIQPTGGSSIGSYAASHYNGNITGTVWKTKGDNEIRQYDFTYDAVNRLTAADFNQYTAASFNKTAGIDFSVSNLSFDANGNVLSMSQKGWKVGGSSYIDQLTYNYEVNSNKLKNVIDVSNDVNTKLADFRSSLLYMTALGSKTSSATDYVYDNNGNLLKDLNKDIETYSGANGIEYNHLNLPTKITVKGNGSFNKGTIEYTYDNAGNKLKKLVTEGSSVTTTLYLFGNFVNDDLQSLPQEEGRVRPTTDPNNPFVYDYFIKDHLGNVRMVLTEEEKTDAYPPASMETGSSSIEEALYSNLSNTRNDVPAGYPTDTYTNPNNKVAKTNGSGNKIGPAIVLKVMSGDKFNVRVSSWYKKNGATPGTPVNPFSDLLAALNGSIGSLSGSKATTTELQNSNALSTPTTQFLNSQSGYTTTKPKAFLNWILFDERFKYVSSSSGFEQVGDDEEFKVHQFNALPINKHGYLYIYVSNETPNIDVFFDNLQVTHIRGPILEETHYYPFGLAMAGISSKAAAFGKEAKEKFNDGTELANKEFSDGSGLELYETPFRGYDPQIGRFWQIDAMADDYEAWSPYVFAMNNPISLNDPTGLASEKKGKGFSEDDRHVMTEVVIKYSPKSKKNYSWWTWYVDVNKDYGYDKLFNHLINQGVNERGLRLFNQAWSSIGYRERLKEWDEDFGNTVEFILEEGGTLVVGGPFLKLGVKGVKYGHRAYKLFKKGKTVKGGKTIVGETMARVEAAAAKNPGSVILNNMPKFSGEKWQVTSQMMQYNRQWLLQQMRSGRPILDIGLDPARKIPSIFYQMEQNMLKNYQKLHPGSLNIIKL